MGGGEERCDAVGGGMGMWGQVWEMLGNVDKGVGSVLGCGVGEES